MKKNLLFLPLFAALALTGCSKDEAATEVGSGISDGEPRYLAVSIATTPSLGETTRAVDKANENGGYTQSNGNYEDGLEAENEVKKVRFYFFTETGAAMSVKSGSTVNYYDCTPSTEVGGTDHTQTVAKGLEAVVVINTAAGDQLPSSMIAVVNPTANLEKAGAQKNGALNRDELMAYTEDFTNHTTGFMMSNSVYLSSANEQIDDVEVHAAYYCTSPEEAKENPVRIYVERSMAKVRVELGADLVPQSAPVTDAKGNAHDLIALTYLDDKNAEQPLTIGKGDAAKQVYVELLGWGVDGVRDNGFALKHIKAGWSNNAAPDGMDAAWNLPQLHRCFWADGDMNYLGNTYFNYNDLKTLPFTGTNYTYCNENAERYTGTLATSVVIPARLCDETGAALTICEYGGVRFVDDENLAKMEEQILFRMKNAEDFFWTKETDGAWRQIDERDIELVPLYSAPSPTDNTRYYVKAQLTEAAKALEWHKSEPVAGGAEPAKWTTAEIAAAFKTFEHIKVWKNGMTYYALFIPHLGTAGTTTAFGVVRNHVYAITIDNIYGLGTPVYDPSQKIIPEKVVEDNVYVSAKVELLSWRLVANNVTLDWGK